MFNIEEKAKGIEHLSVNKTEISDSILLSFCYFWNFIFIIRLAFDKIQIRIFRKF